jgi:hypothetical protein
MAKKPKTEFEWHPVACTFPIPTGAAFDAMVEDLKMNGLKEKGKMWIDATGKYVGVDGRFREKACEAADVEFTFQILKLPDEAAVIAYILSRNLARRHLNQSQRALVGARLLPIFAEEAEKRQKAGKRVEADLPDGQKGRAREHVAALINVSERLIQDARTLLESDSPELIQLVERGENSISAVLEIVKNLPKEEQEKIVVAGKKAVKETATRIRKHKKADKSAEKSDSKSPTENEEPSAPTAQIPPAPDQTERVETPPPAQAPAVEAQIPEWVAALPERIRKGFEKHVAYLPKIESIQITIRNGERRSVIEITATKGRPKPPKPAAEQPKPTAQDDDQKVFMLHIGMIEEANRAAGNKKYTAEKLTDAFPVWSSVKPSTEVLDKIMKVWDEVDIEGVPPHPTMAFILDHYSEMKAAVGA